jgi:ketosteroid isomerase-like protein
MRQNSIEKNLAVVNEHFELEAANEIEKALHLYTDDIVWEAPARGILLHGKNAAADNYFKMFGAMADSKVTSLRRFATPDRVVDDSTAAFRLAADGYLNAPLPVGSEVESRLIHIFDMYEGKIARETVYETWRNRASASRASAPSLAPAASRATEPTPERIIQLGLGFWGPKALLSAVELGLFTELARGPLEGGTLAGRLGLHRRGCRDFLDALVALGTLERRGDRYANSPDADFLLDRNKPSYIGGLLEFANTELWRSWGALTEALRTGRPQTESQDGRGPFEVMYSDPKGLRGFLQAMTGLSTGIAEAIAQKFPWHQYRTFIDIGTAQGATPVQLAKAHPHLTGKGFDLPVVRPFFAGYVKSFGLSNRLQFHAGDFFKEPLPAADVLLMGHILHDWNLEEKRMLIAKAWAALPPEGALIVFEALIDDARQNAFGLLMSLNMLVQTPGGFDFAGAECSAWMREAGFRKTRVERLVGTDSMVIGIK